MFYISRIEIQNFRCFESVIIDSDVNGHLAPWTLLTGDNGSGKTTLLKAIALGLCDQSSAAGLLRESDSGYIRSGQDFASIKINLVDRAAGSTTDEIEITTTLTQQTPQFERLEQHTDPGDDFPWDEIFVCGYGAGRGTSGTGDISGYSAINAVYNLFNYSEGLQNPELTIRRLQHGSSRQVNLRATLESLLNLTDLRLAEDETGDGDRTNEMGISIRDPRNVDIALRDLADGYKSTFLWVTDFLGWAAAFEGELDASTAGIVVIDEIEQHLHPKWQKSIISTLRETWPHVQFFAATHSPLVARSFQTITKEGPHRHYHLRDSEGDRGVEAVQIDSLVGLRTDQILATAAFDFLIDIDPDSAQIIQELAYLAGNKSLDEEQRGRFEDYLKWVKEIDAIRRGQTLTERTAAQLAELTEKNLIEDLEQRLFG